MRYLLVVVALAAAPIPSLMAVVFDGLERVDPEALSQEDRATLGTALDAEFYLNIDWSGDSNYGVPTSSGVVIPLGKGEPGSPVSRHWEVDDETYGCSGFLIAPDLALTAGHCVEYFLSGSSDCHRLRAVFGFRPERMGPPNSDKPVKVLAKPGKEYALAIFPRKDIYRCVSVVGHEYNVGSFIAPDWAVLKLEPLEKVERPYLTVNYDDIPLKKGTRLAAVGHPFKISQSVAVGNVKNSDYQYIFRSNLSIAQGMSGGPVVMMDEPRKGQVVGIVDGRVTKDSERLYAQFNVSTDLDRVYNEVHVESSEDNFSTGTYAAEALSRARVPRSIAGF